MTDIQTTIGNQSMGGATTVQGLFLIHHLLAMQNLQTILVQPFEHEDDRWAAFNRQSLYLLSLITDDEARRKVKEVIDRREAEQKTDPWYKNERGNQYMARLAIITELCRYLSQSMDLIHHDILSSVGAGVSDVVGSSETPDAPVIGEEGVPVD